MNHWGIGKGKEESEKQSREYWNLIKDDNTGRLKEKWNNYWNIGSWFTGIPYWNLMHGITGIPKHGNPERQPE